MSLSAARFFPNSNGRVAARAAAAEVVPGCWMVGIEADDKTEPVAAAAVDTGAD